MNYKTYLAYLTQQLISCSGGLWLARSTKCHVLRPHPPVRLEKVTQSVTFLYLALALSLRQLDNLIIAQSASEVNYFNKIVNSLKPVRYSDIKKYWRYL